LRVRRVQTFSDLIFVLGANGTNAVLSNVSFQMYSDSTSYAHPLLLGLAYAMFVDQNGRTAFESTNGLTIMDMTNSSVRST
jgi:hypothetical protein